MKSEIVRVGKDAIARRFLEFPGVADKLIAQGVSDGDAVLIDSMLLHSVAMTNRRERANGNRALSEPTALELAANFAGAMSRWASAGFRTVSAEQYAARSAVCDACEMWDGAARLGLGKCKAPGCGCTSMKRWLASERCPLDKWHKV